MFQEELRLLSTGLRPPKLPDTLSRAHTSQHGQHGGKTSGMERELCAVWWGNLGTEKDLCEIGWEILGNGKGIVRSLVKQLRERKGNCAKFGNNSRKWKKN